MDYVKKSIEKRAMHKMEYDIRVNERLMQTTEEKIDTSNAPDALDASSDPFMIEERGNQMAEVQTTDDNVSATGQSILSKLEFNIGGMVDQIAEQCTLLSYRYIVQSYRGRTSELVRNKERYLRETGFMEILSDDHTMMSDHNSSDLAPQRQEMASAENNTSGPARSSSNDFFLIITVQNSQFKTTEMNSQVQSWFQKLFLQQTRQLHHNKSWNYYSHHIAIAEDKQGKINTNQKNQKISKKNLLDMSLGIYNIYVLEMSN
ncbi:hypothetical protein Tco_0152473 [Tanacetum coccineum]